MFTIIYPEILNFLVSMIGYFLIYMAIDTHRPNDKINCFSKHWWLTLLLVGVALIILRNVDMWFPL